MMQNLPDCAYFSAGSGTPCDAIRRALEAVGFRNIQGPTDSQKASELWIQPPRQTNKEISPPGTEPKQPYDTASLITLVGMASSARRA